MSPPPLFCLVAAALLSVACASDPGATPRVRRSRPQPTVEPSPDVARAPRPQVFPRERWGAAPLDPSDASPMNGVSRLTIHHTGEPGPSSPGSIEEAAGRMRGYQRAHVEGRGWSDIGYHFVIDPNGRTWEGRELAWQGAHAGNGDANRHNVGVSLMGNFDVQPVPPAQRAALAELVHWLVEEHRIRSEDIYTHSRIKREYDLPGTACPGENLRRFVEDLQDELRDARPRL